MQVCIHAHGAPVGAMLAGHAHGRLVEALDGRSDHVERLEIRLGDAQGADGRQDPYCLIHLRLAGQRAATVVDFGADLYDAIERAAHRAGHLTDAHVLQSDRAGSDREPFREKID